MMALGQEMPSAAEGPASGVGAGDIDEHAAAMLPPTQYVGRGVHDSREGRQAGKDSQAHQPSEADQGTVQHLGHRRGAHPDGFGIGPERLQGAEIGDVDQGKEGVAQGHAPGRGDGEAYLFGEGISLPGGAVGAQRNRLARVAGDRADHVQTDTGEGGWGDTAFDVLDRGHAVGQAADNGGGQNRETRSAGQHENTGGFRRGIEPVDPGDEIGAVGEVDIMHSEGDAGFHHRMGRGAVSLERTAGIDQNVGPMDRELRGNVAPPVELGGDQPRLGAASGLAVIMRFRDGSAGDDEGQAGVGFQQFDDTAAECAVGADDEDGESGGHRMERSAWDGSSG